MNLKIIPFSIVLKNFQTQFNPYNFVTVTKTGQKRNRLITVINIYSYFI